MPERNPAVKIRINDILSGEFVKGEGWDPSYILKGTEKIFRVNIIAVIIQKAGPDLLIDDSFSQIACRSQNDQIGNVEVGDMINIIGRPREYGNDRFIIPDIIRKVNPTWFILRKKELGEPQIKTAEEPSQTVQKEPSSQEGSAPQEEVIEEKSALSPSRLIDIIREMDQGQGVDQDALLKKADISDGDQVISFLLKEGEIFEISPGRIKVLE